MAKINTVLGAIEDNFLGETLFHEHVFCANPSFCNAFGNSWFPREQVVERAIKLFKQAKEECGVQTIVDATPIDLGRKVEIIKEVSMSAFNESKPTSVLYGTVESESPLRIRIDQKITLSETFLVLSNLVKDSEVNITIDGITQKCVIHNSLKKNETVILIRYQGGQKYLVLDRM